MSKLRSLAISSFAISLTTGIASVLALGCGAGTPPPRPAEVAMEPSSGGSSSNDPTSSTSTTSAASSDDPSAAMMGASDPSVAPPAPAASPDPTPDPAPGKGGKKGKKGGGLSSAECQQLSDKGIDLLIAGMGGADPSMVAQLKAQAAGDPNMANMLTECQKSTTRAQYKCGMAATSKAAWETCLK